ncbi:hypothetical protein WJX84_001908 [Apatococcus fuscideae]|uniref:Aminotransferase class I/classII large domain-containing protein n=1 Tax=Apatococcus fuscideae TaxID=2026836 RepID=A0AAW1T6R9_9CHLO
MLSDVPARFVQSNGVAGAKLKNASDAVPQSSTAVDWATHLTAEAKLRSQPTLRRLVVGSAGKHEVAGLHGGLPHPSIFPLEGITLHLKGGASLTIDDPQTVTDAQQYNLTSQGYDPLREWVRVHTNEQHHPPPSGQHDILITNGNNHTFEVLVANLVGAGGCMLCEEFTYPHVVESVAVPLGIRLHGVAMDAEGLQPDALRQAMQNAKQSGSSVPKVLYIIPTGQNPTGAVSGLDRKKAIYQICQEEDIIILEDDPYYYLQFSTGPGEQPGLAGLQPSYLSLDVDGRVARMDTFSKFLVPGLRLGWLTVHPELLLKACMTLQGATVGACGLSQVITAELMRHWEQKGQLEAHVRDVQGQYARRAACLLRAADSHLQGLAEWVAPTAGMFLWMRLLHCSDADDVIQQLVEAGIIVLPGRVAHFQGPCPPGGCPFIRMSFSKASSAEMENGISTLAWILRARSAQANGSSKNLAPTALPSLSGACRAATPGMDQMAGNPPVVPGL